MDRFGEGPTGGIAGGPAAVTARGLGLLLLAGLTVLILGGGGALTRASRDAWAALALWTMVCWAGWLLWRTVLSDAGIPANVLHPFLAPLFVLLVVHLLAGARTASSAGEIALLSADDPGVLSRLMVFVLLMLMVQDVLPRLREGRWALTCLGLVTAAGPALRLTVARSPQGALALAMSGCVGVGMLVAPVLLPSRHADRRAPGRMSWLFDAETVGRLGLAGLLVAVLAVSHYQAAAAAVLAAAVAGGAMLLAGVVLPGPRRRLLVAGAVVAVGGGAGLLRLGPPVLAWVQRTTWLGSPQSPHLAASGDLAGLAVIALTTGWVGAAVLIAGMLTSLVWSLLSARRSAPGDQARAALWGCVAAVSGAALLAEGGLAVPAVAVTAAVVWGLVPHMAARHVGRLTGWTVTAAFLAFLVVIGLEQRTTLAASLPARWDGPMHALGAGLLAAVLLWQFRARRWWHGLLCALIGGSFAAIGELGQKYLSVGRRPEWSDAAWDAAGAGLALALFLVTRAAGWLERRLSAKPKAAYDKYDTWQVP